MIRLIQRRLIIPRGDTGSFSIPTIGTVGENDVAIFGIFDPLTHKTVVMKKVTATNTTLTISLNTEDTINLEPRKYNWDITIYKEPIYDEDQELIGAAEVNSYYSAFKLPVCEITEVALDMNKDRWATASLTLDTNKYQMANNIQTVYPWEKIQRSQLKQQLYELAKDYGYTGTEDDFMMRFIGGVIITVYNKDFPIPGDSTSLYFETSKEILYYFKQTTEEVDEQVASAVGAIIVDIETEAGVTTTSLYIPVKAMPVENLIIHGGEIG